LGLRLNLSLLAGIVCLSSVAYGQEPVDSPSADAPPVEVPAADAPAAEAAPVPEEAAGSAGPIDWNAPYGEVERIAVQGNLRIETAAVLAAVQLRVGERVQGAQLRRDLKSVFATGLFQDVRIDVSAGTKTGVVVVTFMVHENPAIRAVNLSGQKKLNEDDIRDVMDINAYAVLNPAALSNNQQRIREFYVDKGYFLVEVEPVIHEVSQSLVDVEFVITENRKVYVENVDITGNVHIEDRAILKFMATRPAGALPWLTGSGTYRSGDLDNDVYVVRSVFLEEGFVDVKVNEPKVYLSPDKRTIAVTIHVEEGERYRIGSIDAKGDWVPEEGLTMESVLRLVAGESVEEVLASLDGANGGIGSLLDFRDGASPIKTGDTFKLTDIQMVIQRISDLFSARGYAFASVVPLTKTRPEDGIVELTFDISKGDRFQVGKIHVTGNDPTWDKVVRREIPLNEAEVFDGSKLQEARTRLQRLGFFEDVRFSTPRASTPQTLDVNVEVVEQPTGSFSIGAGFSSVENFVFTGNVSKNNFLGLGYVMSAAVNWSGLRQQGNLSFADPHFLDSQWTFKVDAYSVSQQYTEDQYTRGGGLTIGRYLDEREDWRLSGSYTLEDVGLTQITSYQERLLGGKLYASGLTSSLGLSLYVDKRNNRILPTHGIYGSVSANLSGGLPVGDGEVKPFIGGEFNLWETKSNLRFYQPVIPGSDRLIFRLNSTLGFIGSTDGSVVPYVHRYRAGGINSVRGYNWYSLGPTLRNVGTEDPARVDDTLIVGGTSTWINNIELEAPIVKSAGISAVVFFDAGNAFGDPWGEGSVSVTGLRFAYGAGLRWFSPIGPLRFELGFPINPRTGEEKSVFDFSIGSFF
jgi:outer membrane protein insertion porin family